MYKLVVLSVLFAAVAASPSVLSPIGLGWGLGTGVVSPWATPLIAPIAAAPIVAAPNYRGPLSLAPGQPANILAADGRPLDTLSVNLDRAAHYTARAVDRAGIHLLKKRSILATPWAAPAVAVSHATRIDTPARLIAPAPLITSVPWIAPAPLTAAAPLGLASWRSPIGLLGNGIPLGRVW